VPDIGKIKGLLNFWPTRNIEEIVRSVIDYYQAETRSNTANGPVLAMEGAF
jgi:hypothetical protein